MAGTAAIMCAEDDINGISACGNAHMLNDVLKGKLGFQGYIISDWFATHSTDAAAAGLDITQPGWIGVTADSGSYFGGNLTAAVNAGQVSQERLNNMATRILAAWFYMGQDDLSYPAPNYNTYNLNDPATNEHVDVQEDHYRIVREIGAASAVLLKNNGALPLKKPRTMVLVGASSSFYLFL
jgi:beta-glucosidase-like glycosyl hydrolase